MIARRWTTIAFWAWFTVATASLGRLWSTVETGGLFVRFGPADAIALLLLVVSGLVLGRAQYRLARLVYR
ncbi:MAG: hypothetical protein HY553_09730 [Elusimicrobia bacterium]|nr:hypothetical protein [Elusimicrobiota bacterium]